MSARELAVHGGAEAVVRRPRAILVLLTLAAVCAGAILVAAALGSAPIPLGEAAAMVLRALRVPGVERTWPEADEAILLQLRLPRVLGAFLTGVGLAAAGTVMQGVFRNPLADPYVLGSSAGAGLGAVLALALGPRFEALGFGPVPLLAFCGALGATLLVYALARVGWRTPTPNLLLAGLATTSLFASLTSLVLLLAPIAQLQLPAVLAWLLGGVTLSGWQEIPLLAPLLVLGVLAAVALARPLDALALGEEGASYLGIPVERAKLGAIAVASLLTALAVATSGLIGFVGLLVPHAVRLVVGPRHRLLVPASALSGGAFLVLMDLLARTVLAPGELPVGVLTALLGAPFFLWLLRRGRGGYAL